METVHLREFIDFARSLSYSKASKELFISQPTLRSHIKSLEDEVGVPLFIRQEGRLELSLAGKLLLKNAREITKLTDATVSECRQLFKNSTSILAGTMGYPLFESLLASARDQFGKKYPDYSIDLRFATSTHANVATITERNADITLLPRLKNADDPADTSSLNIPSTVEAFFLRSENCSFWMTSANPLFEKEKILLSDLSGQSLLLGNTDNMVNAGKKFSKYFEKEGVDILVDHQPFSSYIDYVFSMCQDAFGTFVEPLHPTLKTHAERRMFLLDDLPMRYDIFAIFDRSSFDDIGLLFLQQLETLSKDLLPE